MQDLHLPPRFAALLTVTLLVTACETGLDPTPDDGSPPGADVTKPFPIDRGDDGLGTPGKYKGLWLRLFDNGRPLISRFEDQVGVVCVGVSETADECADFIARINSHWLGDVANDVRVLNCGRREFGLEQWIDPDYDFELWEACIYLLMPYVGMRPEQIRVVYHQAGNSETTYPDGSPLPTYPDPESNYHTLYDNLTAFSERVYRFFPNLQAVYTSSRSYGGFTRTGQRGEPLTYEEGHAVNSWLANNPFINGVWYGWGAYTWAPPCPADIMNGQGICYFQSDFEADGVKLSPAGRGKISWQIHHRLLLEDWYRR